jgi:hypothetical protein
MAKEVSKRVQFYRSSYLKATLAGSGGFLFTMALAIYWLAIEAIQLPSVELSLADSRLLYWLFLFLVLLLALFFLLTALGGVICLHADAEERGYENHWV